ncbi:MAG: beta-lactamase family protein [Chitinophagaceae bacterium]|nr:beta-lactamase family protein [Chitinophagaceae bacterium]
MSDRTFANCTKVSLLLVSMLFFQSVRAQYDFSAVERKLEAGKKDLGKDAFVIVYKDSKVIYQKGTGEFTVKTQAPIGNASQWLTAALVMVYVDAGKLSLDDKVSKYIPVYTKYSKGYITIRDCLAHLTGLESDRSFNLLGKKKYSSLEEEVNDFAAKKEIESNPGLEFRYSNVGLNIAGRILEIINHRSFEQLMQEKITRPLMMRNTSFASFSSVNPSSGAVSTPNDYINFLSMILNKGMFNGKAILSEKAVAAMQAVVTTPATIKLAPKVDAGFNYGFGNWIMESDENGNAVVLGHPGLTGTWPFVDKCRNYAAVIFTRGTLGEEKKEVYLDIKKSLDEQLKSSCK